MRKVISFLAVIILITAASAVFADTLLLSDNFNTLTGNTDINADLGIRQSGSYAATSVVLDAGTASINDATGVMVQSGSTHFAQRFIRYYRLGKSIHYSFKCNSTSGYLTILIGGAGSGFFNGCPGLGIEIGSGGNWYVDTFDASGYNNGISGGGASGWRTWDIYVTQDIGHKDLIVKLDTTQIYSGSVPDAVTVTNSGNALVGNSYPIYWNNGFLNFSGNGEIDDVSMIGSDVPLTATNQVLLEDRFNVADNADINTDYTTRQSGVYAGTMISTKYDWGGVSEIKNDALKVWGKLLFFNHAFSSYLTAGKTLQFSFSMRNSAYYGYAWISGPGAGFGNGGPGFAVEQAAWATYLDSYSAPGSVNQINIGNDGDWHRYDIDIVPGSALINVNIKQDGAQAWNVDATPNTYWTEAFLNLIAYANPTNMEFDDLLITGTPDAVAIAVTGVTLNKSTLSLAYGTSETLVATVLPTNASNQGVTWSTDNGSVATVSSSGVVTNVSAGTCNIKVTTVDGGYQATCAVTTGAVPAVATGYVAQCNYGSGINVYQVNGGNLKAMIPTSGQAMGAYFADNGDLYFCANYSWNVYKAAYVSGSTWAAPVVYASIPTGTHYYQGAFQCAAKSDGTVFVGSYASDQMYRIDPGAPPTVTELSMGLSGQLGWWDMEISPAGVGGAFWADRQNTGLKNYNADGTDAGFTVASGYDYIRGTAFAHGKYYAHGNDYTTWYEYDPTNAASATPFIVFKDFNSITNLVNYNLSAAFGADANGDGYDDFYFTMWKHDGRGANWEESYNIEIYSGDPDLAPGDKYLGSIENVSCYMFPLTTYPKGSQAPIVYNYAKVNYSDDITVDGDLIDWSDATFTAMDKAYYPDPSVNLDMSNAAYSLKWGAGGTKVYLALKVQDTDPIYTNWYTYWNANDHAEIQLWASGVSGTIDQNICDIAQQYELGLQENGIDKWSYMCGSGEVPDFANFNYAITQGIDGWVFYEAAMSPFTAFSRLDINAVIARVLLVDDVVGADAVIASNNNWADFNMIAGDKVGGKSAYTASIKKRQLTREGVMGSVDLQNYDVSKLGIAGTATISDGTNTEIHKIVLDTAGLYSFTTALRGDCTVVVKCSHWLGKAASVTVPSTGNVVVDLLSVINGDVVESNEVDFDDINATRAAYGSFPGDENWNARADVDGTGEVDFTDINIVRSKYGEIGE